MPDQPSQAVLSSHRTLWFIGTAIAVAAAAALVLVGPGEGSPCLIRAATGVSCPGCGMTRGFAALLRGNWTAMWTMHPLAPFFAIEALVVWVAWGWFVFARRRRVNEPVLLALLVGSFVLLALVWLVRLLSGTLPT